MMPTKLDDVSFIGTVTKAQKQFGKMTVAIIVLYFAALFPKFILKEVMYMTYVFRCQLHVLL